MISKKISEHAKISFWILFGTVWSCFSVFFFFFYVSTCHKICQEVCVWVDWLMFACVIFHHKSCLRWSSLNVFVYMLFRSRSHSHCVSVCFFFSPVNEETLAAMPYLKCCILEAIRLRSPGIITRRVMAPFRIGVSVQICAATFTAFWPKHDSEPCVIPFDNLNLKALWILWCPHTLTGPFLAWQFWPHSGWLIW